VTWGETLEGSEEEHAHSERAAGLVELQRLMDTVVGTLPDKERSVVRFFYGLDGRPRTQKEVRPRLL
jgi:DNA-directed RNA polymerase sigma subunit (sigma70/sigma32)